MSVYALKPSVVRQAIDELDNWKIHPHFSAYLGLTRLAKQQDTTQALSYDYETYYDQYFRMQADENTNMVINGCEKLYLIPFTDSHVRRMWKGKNVVDSISIGTAGSGRATSEVGLSGVVDVDVDAKTYSLKKNHWELARDHLTDRKKVPAEPVVAFMYRDLGFESDEPPEIGDLVELFREEFGFEDDRKFKHLFETETDFTTDPEVAVEMRSDSGTDADNSVNPSESPRSEAGDDYIVEFPTDGVTIHSSEQSEAMVEATKYMVEKHGLIDKVEIPWRPGNKKAVINDKPEDPDSDPIYHSITDDYWVDTKQSKSLKKSNLQKMAQLCGIDITFGGEW